MHTPDSPKPPPAPVPANPAAPAPEPASNPVPEPAPEPVPEPVPEPAGDAPTPAASDAMQTTLNACRRRLNRSRLFFFLAAASFAPPLLFLIIPDPSGLTVGLLTGFPIVSFLGFLFAALINRILAYAKAKASVAAHLIPELLTETFGRFVYRPDACLPARLILQNQPYLAFPMDRISGSDFIETSYRGCRLKMSDIKIEAVHWERNPKTGEAEERRKTVFSGLWLVCDFTKKIRGSVTVASHSIAARGNLNPVYTENEAFNRSYAVLTEDEEEAFYLLTPPFMELILQHVDSVPSRSYLHFTGKGTLHLALDTSYDLLEIHQLNKETTDDLKNRFRKEIHQVLSVLDGLRLTQADSPTGRHR